MFPSHITEASTPDWDPINNQLGTIILIWMRLNFNQLWTNNVMTYVMGFECESEEERAVKMIGYGNL